MRIYSLSKVIALPLVAMLAVFLAVLFGNFSPYSVWVFLPVVLLTALYIFHAQIDFWWLSKHPLDMDVNLQEWLRKYSPFYQNLAGESLKKFEQRIMLYIEAREFKSVGTTELKEVPFNFVGAISSQAIKLCLGLDDYLIGDLDRIYVYKHPFPSPVYNPLHTVETDTDDGILILSIEHALPGIMFPAQYFNVALYGYADAFIKIFPKKDFPVVSEDDWQDLQKVIPLQKEVIEKTVGMLPLNLLAVHITAFFDFKENYKSCFPKNFTNFSLIFNNEDFF